jgi:hypothetical protein
MVALSSLLWRSARKAMSGRSVPLTMEGLAVGWGVGSAREAFSHSQNSPVYSHPHEQYDVPST